MSNPALSNQKEEYFLTATNSLENERSTTTGVTLKTSLLFSILVCTSLVTFMLFAQGYSDKTSILSILGAFGAFITAIVVIFCRKPSWYAPLSVLYAGLEGLAIGSISAYFAAAMGIGIIFNAILATLVTFAVMLFLYATKVIKCTQTFRSTVILATFSIFVLYLIELVIGLFNPALVSFMNSSSNLSMGVSIFICIIAALNLVLDFDFIDNITKSGAIKEFEWYAGFSLMLTIVWLYLEILRLLAKANSRR